MTQRVEDKSYMSWFVLVSASYLTQRNFLKLQTLWDKSNTTVIPVGSHWGMLQKAILEDSIVLGQVEHASWIMFLYIAAFTVKPYFKHQSPPLDIAYHLGINDFLVSFLLCSNLPHHFQ